MSSVRPGGNINNQFIGILSHCGVPTDVFAQLLEDYLEHTLGVVNTYLENPILLRHWVASIGNIYDIRCRGSDYGDSQAGEDVQEPNSINYNGVGIPTMLHEVCVSLLEAGFLPKTNHFLREKVHWILRTECKKLTDKMHISVAKSANLVCIADDTGILEENQVSIRFNKPFLDEGTGRTSYCITGDVLVARVFHCCRKLLTQESGSIAQRHSEGSCRGSPSLQAFDKCDCIFYKGQAEQVISSLRWRL